MNGGWMTVAAVAEELDVSARTVLRWIDAGKLEAIRLPGGRLRIAEAERVVAWSTGSSTLSSIASGTLSGIPDEEDSDGTR
jgi:excisionase family DNA binding protein